MNSILLHVFIHINALDDRLWLLLGNITIGRFSLILARRPHLLFVHLYNCRKVRPTQSKGLRFDVQQMDCLDAQRDQLVGSSLVLQ